VRHSGKKMQFQKKMNWPPRDPTQAGWIDFFLLGGMDRLDGECEKTDR
jgi:hypothetical protein